MPEFFVVSGLLFWIVLFVALSLITFATEVEAWPQGILALVIFIAGFLTLTDVGHPVAYWIMAHPFLTVLMIPPYFAVGALWAFFWKWRNVVREAARDFREQKAASARAGYADYVAERDRWNGNQANKDSQKAVDSYDVWVRKNYPPPLPANRKDAITTWILFWPFSVSWSLLSGPRRVAIWIYDRLKAAMVRMSERIMGDAYRG